MRSKNLTIWVMVVILCLGSSQVSGVVEFKDGGTHDIDYEINDDVWVDYQAPGMATTVNLLPGGVITNYYYLHGYNDSRINISGGSMVEGSLWAFDRSQVTFSGGWIKGTLKAWDSSQVTVSGGSIGHHLWADGSSRITMSGGSIGKRIVVGYSPPPRECNNLCG